MPADFDCVVIKWSVIICLLEWNMWKKLLKKLSSVHCNNVWEKVKHNLSLQKLLLPLFVWGADQLFDVNLLLCMGRVCVLFDVSVCSFRLTKYSLLQSLLQLVSFLWSVLWQVCIVATAIFFPKLLPCAVLGQDVLFFIYPSSVGVIQFGQRLGVAWGVK